MTDPELISLIDKAKNYRSETDNIEFKDARGGIPGDLWRPISSFSHSPGGGVIVFGIKDDRDNHQIEIVGNPDLALLQEQILSYLRDRMQNPGVSELRIVEYQKTPLIALIVQETQDELKPCFRKDLGLPNGACVRIGNNDRVITDAEMRTFIRNSAVFKFDRTQATDTDISMLDSNQIKDFLVKSATKVGRSSADNTPTEEVMRNLGIVNQFKGQTYPTFAGFMIFAESEPQRISKYSRYLIRCVRYQGNSVATPIIDKLDIDGTLGKQIDDMHKFVLRNIALKASIEGTKRVDRYEYPDEAIRELVANAVIHRDYMITETYTQVNVFANRIEISNPGNLPPGVTIENIKDSQFSRNEIIASILKDLDYLEEYGRGIDIVFSKMKEWGLLEPIFKNMSNTFRVTLLGEALNELNERQVVIWNTLQEKRRITARECKEMFPDVSRATIGVDLNKLVELGLIIPKSSSYNTYYEPQY